MGDLGLGIRVHPFWLSDPRLVRTTSYGLAIRDVCLTPFGRGPMSRKSYIHVSAGLRPAPFLFPATSGMMYRPSGNLSRPLGTVGSADNKTLFPILPLPLS